MPLYYGTTYAVPNDSRSEAVESPQDNEIQDEVTRFCFQYWPALPEVRLAERAYPFLYPRLFVADSQDAARRYLLEHASPEFRQHPFYRTHLEVTDVSESVQAFLLLENSDELYLVNGILVHQEIIGETPRICPPQFRIRFVAMRAQTLEAVRQDFLHSSKPLGHQRLAYHLKIRYYSRRDLALLLQEDASKTSPLRWNFYVPNFPVESRLN